MTTFFGRPDPRRPVQHAAALANLRDAAVEDVVPDPKHEYYGTGGLPRGLREHGCEATGASLGKCPRASCALGGVALAQLRPLGEASSSSFGRVALTLIGHPRVHS